MKKIFPLILCLLVVMALCACGQVVETFGSPRVTVTPAPTATPEPEATPEPTPEPTATPRPDLPPAVEVELSYSNNIGAAMLPIHDNYNYSGVTFYNGTVIHLESETPFAGLYFYWDKTPAVFTVEAEDFSVPGGQYGMLHEYLTLPESVTSVDIKFTGNSPLYELKAYTEGDPPEDVQVWEPPCEKADLMVFSAHSDDDVIFFGALIADSVARGLDVEVCYLVNHALPGGVQYADRNHELLNALWSMGVRHYPVVGPYPDYFVDNLWAAQSSYGDLSVTNYMVGLIRRFRPSVIVTHDREGEYGHGTHMLCAVCMEEAVPQAADPTVDPKSAEAYGVWDTPKLYLHFADENPIFLSVEVPLDYFGGRTAFEVAQQAMYYHVSQLEWAHRPTLESKTFKRYDCRRFGLVRSTVGLDTSNDIMENIEY